MLYRYISQHGTFSFDVVLIPDHLSVEDVECLQKGHGGWNPKMEWVRTALVSLVISLLYSTMCMFHAAFVL